MPTWRGFKKYAFQGGLYEAQDVLVETDDVDLICVEPGAMFSVKEAVQRRLLWRDPSGKVVHLNPGLKPIHLTQDYDLFVVVCQNWWDVPYVNAIKNWKTRCRTSVCWFDELWAGCIPDYRHWLHALNQFDHVVVGMGGSVPALEKALGRPCHWGPGAVDALRFSPYPAPPARVIDIYSMGRKLEKMHQAFLKLAARREVFYIYDTFPGSMAHPPDHRQHRELIANMAKRSRYFVVAPAKAGVQGDTHGQVEIGYRFFEGAAAGAVMIGQAPDCQSFKQLFGWPDSVVEISPDGSDAIDKLKNLEAQPERLETIRRRNARESLLRHDWVYRWKEILRLAGLKPRPAMEQRERLLTELAAQAA